jgi:hypothetical protein
MADEVRVNCVPEQYSLCRSDEPCRSRPEQGFTLHFTFDLKDKSGSLVFCYSDGECQKPSPLTVVYDYCGIVHSFGVDCLSAGIIAFEKSPQETYAISDLRYVGAVSGVVKDHGYGGATFGRCVIP